MDFIEDNQVEEGRRELLEDITQSLERHREQTLRARIWIVPTMNAGTRFAWQVFFKTIFSGLINQGRGLPRTIFFLPGQHA